MSSSRPGWQFVDNKSCLVVWSELKRRRHTPSRFASRAGRSPRTWRLPARDQHARCANRTATNYRKQIVGNLHLVLSTLQTTFDPVFRILCYVPPWRMLLNGMTYAYLAGMSKRSSTISVRMFTPLTDRAQTLSLRLLDLYRSCSPSWHSNNPSCGCIIVNLNHINAYLNTVLEGVALIVGHNQIAQKLAGQCLF